MNDGLQCGQRALVTGATGYIGSNLVHHLLAEGWEVHIVIRPSSDLSALGSSQDSVQVHEHDGTTQGMANLVRLAKPNVVFHLASLFLAQHKSDDISALVHSNILFSTQLVEAMASHDVKYIVNTGTSWQHYENKTFCPVNLYAATKQAFEDILTYYTEAHGIKATTLTLFDTYGPRDPRQKLIALLWKTAISQEPLVMSPGDQLIELVHVNDVVDAFFLAAKYIQTQSKNYTRFGVGSRNPMKLRELVVAFEKATGTFLPITWSGRPYRPREVMVTWTAFDPVPGWTQKIAFEDGIKQTRPNIL